MAVTDTSSGLKDGRVVAIAGPVVDVEFPPDAGPGVDTARGLQDGRVVAIAGPVVDVESPPDAVPAINTALEMTVDVGGETVVVGSEGAPEIREARGPAHLRQPTR